MIAAPLLAKLFFREPGDFLKALRYAFQPDWLSLFRGEWLADQWSSLKMSAWIICSGAVGVSVYAALR